MNHSISVNGSAAINNSSSNRELTDEELDSIFAYFTHVQNCQPPASLDDAILFKAISSLVD